MKIIDPHLHLFNLKQGDYQWLKADNPPFWSDKKVIEKNFNEKHLQLEPPLELAGFVHIEAGFDNQQPWREIAWLESTCSLPFKSIAAIDLTLPTPEFLDALMQLSRFDSVIGVRDILDDNALEYLSNLQVQDNFAQLAQHKFIFECQMPLSDTKATAQLIEIVANNPTLSLVINHAGWPPENSNSDAWTNWQQSIEKLSAYKDITIKCSGFEMASRQYTPTWQQQVIKQCITSFGLHRTMLASNFPLCLFKESYQENWLTHQENSEFSASELELLCHKNAQRIYRFVH
jgi:predicted TIM-barrel fold metal-dependent hydrolase